MHNFLTHSKRIAGLLWLNFPIWRPVCFTFSLVNRLQNRMRWKLNHSRNIKRNSRILIDRLFANSVNWSFLCIKYPSITPKNKQLHFQEKATEMPNDHQFRNKSQESSHELHLLLFHNHPQSSFIPCVGTKNGLGHESELFYNRHQIRKYKYTFVPERNQLFII